MKRAAAAACWIAPPLICLALYWHGLASWFRADDFAWLGIGMEVESWRDLPRVLFSARAQGTIRPLSERLFFMLLFGAFGLDALPFKLVVFATQIANLTLLQSVARRLTGSRAAGVAAALLWIANSAQAEPLGWTTVYNQPLCAFFMLAAFRFLLLYIESGARRYYWWQWAAFLGGFGALELNLTYPALAAAYTLLRSRRHLLGTLPMIAVSAVYVVLHNLAAPVQKTGVYAMHFTGSVFKTLFTYWTWSVGPTFLWTPMTLPAWFLPAGIAIVSAALIGFAAWKAWRGEMLGVFCLAWYAATLAPVLPLRDHLTEYYVLLPLLGLSILGGWAMAEAWRKSTGVRACALAVAALYVFMTTPEAVAASKWNYDRTVRVRDLVQGVAGAHELHPKKALLLEGVDTDLFHNAILDRPFRLLGVDQVYLAPGSEQRIESHPEWGDVNDFILPAAVAARALERDELVVYAVGGPRLRNITRTWAALQRPQSIPARIDAASELTSFLLGPEWYPSDRTHRWMPGKATLRIAGPKKAGAKLWLRGNCPAEHLAAGRLTVSVAVAGKALGEQAIVESAFEVGFDLPAELVGAAEMPVEVRVSRTFRPPADPRELGLAFGTFEVR
jgi:hypothetical protein